MSGFSAEWLALREPYDYRARSAALERRLAVLLGRRAGAPLQVVDLGGGTGANFRHLATLIGGAQCWRVAENAPELIAAFPRAVADWAARERLQFGGGPDGWRVEGTGFCADLRLSSLDLAREQAGLALGSAHLVTASALLDLVSGGWLDTLLARCAVDRSIVLFALSYDGRIDWQPADPDDALVRGAFNAHQQRDKGFGPALGPAAAGHARRSLAALGYRVEVATSDWLLGADDAPIARALLEGCARAAIEAVPDATEAILRWLDRRLQAIAGARCAIRVGHQDLIGSPAPAQGRP